MSSLRKATFICSKLLTERERERERGRGREREGEREREREQRIDTVERKNE